LLFFVRYSIATLVLYYAWLQCAMAVLNGSLEVCLGEGPGWVAASSSYKAIQDTQ